MIKAVSTAGNDGSIVTKKNMEPSVFPPFNPFVRHPTSLIGKIRMLIFSFLVPVRVFGAISTMLWCLAWCKICLFLFGRNGNDESLGDKPYTPIQRMAITGGCSIFSRILLFWYGFLWIDVSYEDDDEPEAAASAPTAPIIVVNHLGFAELLYLVWSDGCCFVSKDTNRNLPMIGTIAKCIQTIFVDRAPASVSSSTKLKQPERKTTTDMILERANSPDGTWPPLVVCPEGTTHTGHCLIQFATGAFRSGMPVKPVIVKSPFSTAYGYDTSFSCTNIFLHVLGLMTQPMNSFEVKHLKVYVPNDAEKADPKLYATNVRNEMAKHLRVECYELTWTDKLRFEPSLKLQELGKKKLMERHGYVPPIPNFRQDAFGNPLDTAAATTTTNGNNKKDR